MELTAAGLSGTFTRFPFHPLPCIEDKAEQNIANIMSFLGYLMKCIKKEYPFRNFGYSF